MLFRAGRPRARLPEQCGAVLFCRTSQCARVRTGPSPRERAAPPPLDDKTSNKTKHQNKNIYFSSNKCFFLFLFFLLYRPTLTGHHDVVTQRAHQTKRSNVANHSERLHLTKVKREIKKTKQKQKNKKKKKKKKETKDQHKTLLRFQET